MEDAALCESQPPDIHAKGEPLPAEHVMMSMSVTNRVKFSATLTGVGNNHNIVGAGLLGR
jgi:hypothetical protein